MNTAAERPVPAVAIRRLAREAPAPGTGPAFAFDAPSRETGPAPACALVLESAGEPRARALLEGGCPQVFVGEAALRDSEVVTRLSRDFGPERVGVYVPARRMGVTWRLDTESNADFNVMTPSLGEPAWEVLLADGSGTATLAHWWIGEMLRRGAAAAIVRVDIRDDADLNLCAKLVEACGKRLWIGPLEDADPRFEEWAALAGATQLAVAEPAFSESTHLATLKANAATSERVA